MARRKKRKPVKKRNSAKQRRKVSSDVRRKRAARGRRTTRARRRRSVKSKQAAHRIPPQVAAFFRPPVKKPLQILFQYEPPYWKGFEDIGEFPQYRYFAGYSDGDPLQVSFRFRFQQSTETDEKTVYSVDDAIEFFQSAFRANDRNFDANQQAFNNQPLTAAYEVKVTSYHRGGDYPPEMITIEYDGDITHERVISTGRKRERKRKKYDPTRFKKKIVYDERKGRYVTKRITKK